MTDKIYSFLGLATKAGKVVSGDETSEKALKQNKVSLVIISSDASENTKKSFRDMCSYRNVAIRFYGDKEELGKFVGKGMRSVVAILDKGFAKRLIELIDNANFLNGGEVVDKEKSI